MGRAPRRGQVLLAVIGVGALASCTGAASGDETTSPTPAEPRGDGTLVLASALGPGEGPSAERAAVKAAVNDINAAGGVNGAPVAQVDVDTQDTAGAVAAIREHKVDAVIVSRTSQDAAEALRQAGVPLLWTQPVAAGDGIVGFVVERPRLAEAAAEQAIDDGKKSIGVLAPTGETGKADSSAVTAAVQRSEAALATDVQHYDPAEPSMSVPVTKVKGGNPDALIVLGGSPATGAILAELSVQQLGPATLPLYLAGENVTHYEDLVLTGARGVQDSAEPSEELRQAVLSVDAGVTAFRYAAEAYDATVVAALAAQAAQDDDASAIGEWLAEVTVGGDGCRTFAECQPLIAEGKDLAYRGASGPIDLDDDGQRQAAALALVEYDEDNAPVVIGSVSVTRSE